MKVGCSLLLFSYVAVVTYASTNCRQRKTGNGKNICVCDENYCDNVPKLLDLKEGQYQHYYTTQNKLGFTSANGDFKLGASNVELHIDTSKEFQKVVGFGGAFTDSAGQNIKSMPPAVQSKILGSYFADDGLEYSLCRVPIGGTDFSPRAYSYNDNHTGDYEMRMFALQPEDLTYKIPLINNAMDLRKGNLKLIASMWSPPPWMKTNNDWMGVGVLRNDCYQALANYYLKFFENYDKQGIRFWALTTGNEPFDGFLPKAFSKLNSLGWLPHKQAQWVKQNLRPTLNSGYVDLKIFIHDDNRFALPALGLTLQDEELLKAIDGVAVHWYADKAISSSFLEYTKSTKKDLMLLGTEACSGFLHAFGLEPAVDLGSWQRGVNYVDNMLEDFAYNASGWIDWNMVLDLDGGPVYIKNAVDSPIIINKTSGEFYKQPMFYVMGHFSKFVIPGSIRVESKLSSDKDIKTVAFLRPDNLTSVFVSNQANVAAGVQINDGTNKFTVKVAPKSINTILYK